MCKLPLLLFGGVLLELFGMPCPSKGGGGVWGGWGGCMERRISLAPWAGAPTTKYPTSAAIVVAPEARSRMELGCPLPPHTAHPPTHCTRTALSENGKSI